MAKSKTKVIEKKLLDDSEKEIVDNTIGKITSKIENTTLTNTIIINKQKNIEKNAEQISQIIKTAKSYITNYPSDSKKYLNIKSTQYNIKKSQAWAILFVETVLNNCGFTSFTSKYFNGSIEKILNNFINAKIEIKKKPNPGDLVIWLSGKNQGIGDIGIVTFVDDFGYKVISGTTKRQGQTFETYFVSENGKQIDFSETSGLNLKGFVSIFNI